MTESELKKRITDMRDENRRYEKEIADLEDDNRHLAERVKLLEHKRDELIDELKRVGGDKERDIVVGQLMAYRQMFKMILDRGKE